jgi:hypothetical protein
MRRAGIDKITRMRIMGHKTDAMDIRYGVVEDDDIVEATTKLDEAFRELLGNRNGYRDGDTAQEPAAIDPEVLATLVYDYRYDAKEKPTVADGLFSLTTLESMVRRGGLEPPRDCSR